MRKLIALSLALLLMLTLACAGAETPEAGPLMGGWAMAESSDITPEIQGLLENALDSYQTGTVTVAYTPVAYLGSQVVAGTNHAILCKASEINRGSAWVIIYLYQDLEGNVTVLDIADLPLGI